MDTSVSFNHVGPQFRVSDVAAAVMFYSTVLGFEVDYFAGDPPRYAVVCRDEVYIHLCTGDGWSSELGPGAAFIAVNGALALWQQIEEYADLDVVYQLEERDYGDGVRVFDFAIGDVDGNVLRIGELLGDESS
jgi:catechol 2,3-dioxygenase-like lactoylglutathione lyase family enzyme